MDFIFTNPTFGAQSVDNGSAGRVCLPLSISRLCELDRNFEIAFLNLKSSTRHRYGANVKFVFKSTYVLRPGLVSISENVFDQSIWNCFLTANVMSDFEQLVSILMLFSRASSHTHPYHV